MTTLPVQYAWLADEAGPRMVVEAVRLFGTLEAPGAADNPAILAWAEEVGLGRAYSHDKIPWCGLLMAVVAKRAGKVPPADPLWALNWRNFGVAVAAPMLGDVMVKTRAGGGHVCLYVGEDAAYYHAIGGNQSDQVCIRRFPKSLGWTFRRPIYVHQPANVRRVFLAPTGALSTKEG